MPVFRSLLSKHLTIAAVILLLLGSLVLATFLLTMLIQGEAQRINLAGRQRMHLFHIANHMHFLTTVAEKNANPTLHLEETKKSMAAYSQTLYELNDNSKVYIKLPAVFIPDSDNLTTHLTGLINLWEKQQRPLLLEIIADSGQHRQAGEKKCKTCHAAFVNTFDQVDGFVNALARHNDRIIRGFNTLRIAILAFFVAVLFAIAVFVKKKMIEPVKELQAAAAAMEKGVFPAHLAPRTADEIGMLTVTFNRMASALSTNFHEMEKQVAQRTVALQRSNEELETFVYTVSHDLRAPLRAIKGFAGAIPEDAEQLSSAVKSHVANIIDATDSMETLIVDLLQYSRIAFQEIRPERIDMQALLDQALTELSTAIRESDGRVTVVEPLPTVMGNFTILVQILVNLVSNGLKFVAPGTTPAIRIWGEQRGENGRLLITDNGIGIEAKNQKRIFDVFVRLHGAETYAGTGIGLASVSRGIERLGGTYGVSSTPGQGSTFWIELPLA